jgi:hypothetical protein
VREAAHFEVSHCRPPYRGRSRSLRSEVGYRVAR